MTERDAGPTPSLWRAFSIWPIPAIDAVLARKSRAATLALAVVAGVGGVVRIAAEIFSQTPLLATGIGVLAAIASILFLYLQGWLVQAFARRLGGQGSAEAARAAPIWGQLPAIVASVVWALAVVVGARPLALAAAGAVFLCALWGLLRSTWMLAHTHAFSKLRAFVSLSAGLVVADAIVLLAALCVRTLIFQPFSMPSSSMAPTLLPGDFVFASKSAYGYSHFSLPAFVDVFPRSTPGRILASEPNRGDVVVFKKTGDTASDWVKRLVGLPGDKIQLVHGRLIINGETIAREPIAPYPTLNHFGKPMLAPRYVETLPGGVKHEILEIDGDKGLFDNTELFEVPPGHYFVMGDNRDNSADSRLASSQDGIGYVPFENLVGKVEFIYGANDPGRVGTAVR